MLGRTLTPYLRNSGYEVIGQGFSNSVDVECDLTDALATASMINSISPEIVVNLVAETNVDECECNPNKAYNLNIRTVENLVAGFKKNTFLIQISTDQVYDSEGESNENDVKLQNVYAMSKYAGELAALKVNSTILRTNFFGKSKNNKRKSFSDWLIRKLIYQEQTQIYF